MAPGTAIDIDIFHYLVKSAQISSNIMKNLTSGDAFLRNPEGLRDEISELDLVLDHFLNSLPSYLKPGFSVKPAISPLTYHGTLHILFLHFTYYGCCIAIHTIFTYPWLAAMFGEKQRSSIFREQSTKSIVTVAQAARCIILSLRHTEINAATPAWYVCVRTKGDSFSPPFLEFHIFRFLSLSTSSSN